MSILCQGTILFVKYDDIRRSINLTPIGITRNVDVIERIVTRSTAEITAWKYFVKAILEVGKVIIRKSRGI